MKSPFVARLIIRVRSLRPTDLLILFLLLLTAFTHGFNMFHFPYYENDEGVYLSQAWSLFSEGKLAPYTYWYDHAPAGWILLAIWTVLTGGLYTFGFSLNTGRVCMLLLHICSMYLLLFLSKKLTKGYLAGAVAVLFLSFSPLALYFNRRILLDNMMTFWILLSYALLFVRKIKLTHIMASAVCFGIAILTKENAIFFIPGFLYTLHRVSHTYHRHFALAKWIVIVGCIVSSYFLYAFLKGELFPSGTFLGGYSPHVSLLQTLKFQASRGGGSLFDPQTSSFWHNAELWMKKDPYIIVFGLIGLVFSFLIGIVRHKQKLYLGPVFCALFFCYFLVRGGIVIEFYIVPLLPFFALCIGICIHELVTLLSKINPWISRSGVALATLSILFLYGQFYQGFSAFGYQQTGYLLFSSQQTAGQLQTIDWIRKNLKSDDLIVIDNYGFIDLQDPHNPSGIFFPKAHWYWKVDQDPQIFHDVIKESPESIDYIAVTPQMNGDLLMGNSKTTSAALGNSRALVNFTTDGWGVGIWAPRYPDQVLERSWRSYVQTFISPEGKILDPYQEGAVTSEGQSYALLRAVYSNDKHTFANVWNWTKENLTTSTGLFTWKWGQKADGTMGPIDAGTATDADQDIALALLFAAKRWNEPLYRTDAERIIRAIWKEEVTLRAGRSYVTAGNWATQEEQLIFNPSYLAPYAYRIFATVTPDLPWADVVATSYEVLNGCAQANLNVKAAVFLSPEWCALNDDRTYTLPTEQHLQQSEFGYNAVRVNLRVAIDYVWSKEEKARLFLERSNFLLTQYQQNGKIVVGYTHDGKPFENYESVLGYSLALSNAQVTQPALAQKLYTTQVLEKLYENDTSSYWEDPHNYYTNNMAWFATALYTNRLPNLWREYPE